jgi:hypothetical protein
MCQCEKHPPGVLEGPGQADEAGTMPPVGSPDGNLPDASARRPGAGHLCYTPPAGAPDAPQRRTP